MKLPERARGKIGEEPDHLVGGHDGSVMLDEVERFQVDEVGKDSCQRGECFEVHVDERQSGERCGR